MLIDDDDVADRVTLDTPMNRKWMAQGDFSAWTPLDFVAE